MSFLREFYGLSTHMCLKTNMNMCAMIVPTAAPGISGIATHTVFALYDPRGYISRWLRCVGISHLTHMDAKLLGLMAGHANIVGNRVSKPCITEQRGKPGTPLR